MNEIVTTWWTGMLMASAVILFAIVGVHKLHEWCIYPLREMTRFVRRPWFERLLLLFFICGMIHYGATKENRGGGSTDELTRRTNPLDERQSLERSGGDAYDPDVITNLCFTGIHVQTNGVVFDVAWPTNMFVDGTTLDFFAKCHALTNDWRWAFAGSTQPGDTNLSLFADMLVDLGEPVSPAAMFFKVQDRNSCAGTMADSDGDGLPDVYELHNGTNPYVSDYANAPKLTVGPQAPYSTLGAALAASTNYSIIALSSQPESSSEMVVMPPHPVMVTGPADGNAMLHSSASIAAVLMNAGQGSETLFRNLYVVLEARNNFQSAFWIGGNLPWSGVGASPTFENVRVRALYPNVLHYGWHYYRDDCGFSSLSNCVMNAAGSTSAIGVYAHDGPNVGVSDCVFVNFPTNAGSYATWTRSGTNVVAELAPSCTNLSWAGYSLDATYSDTVDSDGDGLSDYEEIHLYDTDPWLSDSDGDGLSDAEEVEAVPPTNPRDLYSFYRRVTVITTTSDSLADTTNYVAWGTSGVGWETNGLAAWRLLPSTNVYEVSSSEGPMYVKTYRDLNRNGQYDENADILLVEQVQPLDAVSSFVFKFGDIDGDGILDAVERQDGSNPYDGKSFRLRAVVSCTDADRAAGVTNYLGIAGESPGARIAFSESGALTIDEIVTNGTCVINCLRDFNGNGVYDEGVDVLYARTLTKTDNGKTVQWPVGDADSDGEKDSDERTDGTDPLDGKNYRLEATIFFESLDAAVGVTNFVLLSANEPEWEDRTPFAFAGYASVDLLVTGVVTNGVFYTKYFRDVNKNGKYDVGVDIFKSEPLSSSYNHKTTGRLVGDYDLDGVADSDELRAGSDPCNSNEYRFNLDLTMGGVFSTSNNLTGVLRIGNRTLIDPFVATSAVVSCVLTNLYTDTGESIAITFWDDVDKDKALDDGELWTEQKIFVDGYYTVVTNRLPLGGFDCDGDGMLDYWERSHGLNTADQTDALLDADGDGLVNAHEFLTGCDPFMPDGSNTAVFAFCNAIDARLRKPENQSQVTYIGNRRNRTCWAYGIDTTSASPWNSTSGGWRAGTAISRRHIIFAEHYQISTNATVRFFGKDDVAYDRTLVSSRNLVGTDIVIGLLSSDLPAAVSPAKILPKDYCRYIGDAKRLPMLMYDYSERSIVTDSSMLQYRTKDADGLVPTDVDRRRHFEEVESGDSGNPKYFVVSNEAILACALHTYGTGASGSGPFVTFYAQRIQATMDFLCPGYRLQECDLTTYESLDDE